MLTIKGKIDIGIFFLQGSQNMVHERYNSGTVLITLLNYVHKGLRLHLTLVLSDCHSDMPRKSFLCKLSPCDSRYCCGRNFMAQSWISKTLLSLRQSMQSVCTASWFKSRSWCDFQSWIAQTASWMVCIASSLSYSDSRLFQLTSLDCHIDITQHIFKVLATSTQQVVTTAGALEGRVSEVLWGILGSVISMRNTRTAGNIDLFDKKRYICSCFDKGCPSSETQRLLAGTMQYFWAKVYFKSWRAPRNLFLPNQFQKRSNSVPLIGQKNTISDEV